jgi:hypothetical protein
MPRSRKRKPGQSKPEGPNHVWWAIAGFVAVFVLLAVYANSPGNIQMLITCYALFGLTVFGSWIVIRSGELYLRGTMITRAAQPVQFWLALALVFFPLFLGSGFIIAMHLRSLFAA